MDIKYIQADKLDFDPRPQMGMIFAESFAHLFNAFSKDTKLWAKTFCHIFDLQYFHLAVHCNEITAMAACTDGTSPIRFDRGICRKELGFLRGWIAYISLTKHLVNHKFPFEFNSTMGRIEDVATASAFRGKGMAYGLLNHIMESTPYKEYALEVIDDNIGAIKLYEKLGFKVIKKVQMPIAARSKINAFLYMKRTK